MRACMSGASSPKPCRIWSKGLQTDAGIPVVSGDPLGRRLLQGRPAGDQDLLHRAPVLHGIETQALLQLGPEVPAAREDPDEVQLSLSHHLHHFSRPAPVEDGHGLIPGAARVPREQEKEGHILQGHQLRNHLDVREQGEMAGEHLFPDPQGQNRALLLGWEEVHHHVLDGVRDMRLDLIFDDLLELPVVLEVHPDLANGGLPCGDGGDEHFRVEILPLKELLQLRSTPSGSLTS